MIWRRRPLRPRASRCGWCPDPASRDSRGAGPPDPPLSRLHGSAACSTVRRAWTTAASPRRRRPLAPQLRGGRCGAGSRNAKRGAAHRVTRTPRSGETMTDLHIPAPLAAALAGKGYDSLTAVQTAMLAPEAAGRDALVSAQTGSGKTVAFGLAIAPDLLDGADRCSPPTLPLALVIAPTRELALQVARELDWLYAGTGAQIATCVGGMDYRNERRALRARRAYRRRHARPSARPHRARQPRPVGPARRRARRGRRDARPRLPRGSGVHPGSGAGRAPHADVLGHRAARHRRRWPATSSATRCGSPTDGRGAPACRHRVSRLVGHGPRPRARDLQPAAPPRGADGDRLLQDARQREPPAGAHVATAASRSWRCRAS